MPLFVTHTNRVGVSPASCRLVGRKRWCTWFWSAAAPIVATWQAVEAGSAGFRCFLVLTSQENLQEERCSGLFIVMKEK